MKQAVWTHVSEEKLEKLERIEYLELLSYKPEPHDDWYAECFEAEAQ